MGEPGWQPIQGTGAPVTVAAARARRPEPGFAVGDTAFASPTAGWAYVGDGRAAQCRVLFTDDAGATWSPQLAWHGLSYGRLAAFDERQAAFALAVSQGTDINGHRAEPHAAGDPFVGPDMFLAGTQDAGATWTLAPNPDRSTFDSYFLTPRQIWLRGHVHGPGRGRIDLIRTQDGGAAWDRLESVDGHAAMGVHFQSAAEGLLVTGEGNPADRLYRTVDAGVNWTREPLEPPPGLPARADVRLDLVVRRGVGVLLVLSAQSLKDSVQRPRWEGVYVYRRDEQQGWAGPYRLPMASTRSRSPHLAACGPDGRIWAAAGHDLFLAEYPAGPWQRRRVPLPPEQVITRLDPVAGGVLWLTTSAFPGVAPSGQLYRSVDDGGHWNRVMVGLLTAWLKMPAPDAQRLANALIGTEFRFSA